MGFSKYVYKAFKLYSTPKYPLTFQVGDSTRLDAEAAYEKGGGVPSRSPGNFRMSLRINGKVARAFPAA